MTMPRKKVQSVPVTIELPAEAYEQIKRQAASWGETIAEWLMEAIQEKL